MCVTAEPAKINETCTYVYETEINGRPMHVSGYQNQATNLAMGGNCMFLNFAGRDLTLVDGPQYTLDFMDDVTAYLPDLVEIPTFRGDFSFGIPKGVTVQAYGDYTVVYSQGPADILSALNEVQPERRPAFTDRLREMVSFYMSYSPDHSFVLGCFNGAVRPKHPIVVGYKPNNPSVLTIPGLDGHDGRIPRPGHPVHRDFRVAFGIKGHKLAQPLRYRSQGIAGKPWAPSSVSGFADNRFDGPNGDYVVSRQALIDGLHGPELAGVLQ